MSVALKATLLPLGILMVASAWGQASATQRSIPGQDSQPQKDRKAAIQKNGRFLGWKFAARSGQDTSKWARSSGTRKRTSSDAVSGAGRALSAMLPRAQTTAGSGFPYPGFGFRAGLPTGYIPTAVAQGDFNQDGNMDVAISNGGDNTVYILLGNGDGTFQVPEILNTQGQAPVWIAATALRNNGPLDLVVADGDSDSVEIFLGNGDGTLQQGAQFSLPQPPTFVLAGDFNKDGKQDVAVGLIVLGGTTAPQFVVLLGDGSGGFVNAIVPPPITATDGDVPTGWISMGDVNNDGFADFVTTITGASAITYLNQTGHGFSQGSAFGPPFGAMVVGLGDLNEDGCLDAVELDGGGLVTVAKGTCDGNFTQGPAAAEVGDLDPALAVIDVNGDGHLDVIGSSAYYEVGGVGYGREAGYLVSVMKGDGHGNLTMASVYRGGMDAYSLVVGDFHGSGAPDVLTTDSSENRATLFLNDGAGNYDGAQGEAIGYPQGVLNAPNPLSQMEAVDLNGDGKPDLILVESGTLSTVPSQLTVMLNDGTGKFLPPVRSPITTGPLSPFEQFITGGFRSSAKPDVIYISQYLSGSNVVAFFPGNGDGTFGSPTTLTVLPNPLLLVAGDFNGDGKLDFAVYGTDSAQANIEIDAFLGHGDGTFTELPPQIFHAPDGGEPLQLLAADINHDGKVDLLIGMIGIDGGFAPGDDLLESLGNGDGTFQAPTMLIPNFGPVALADLNNDGYVDLIQEGAPNAAPIDEVDLPAAVTVYLGGAAGFQKQTYEFPGMLPPTNAPVLLADFTGDGIQDIGVVYAASAAGPGYDGRLRVLRGAGDGTFTVTNHEYDLPSTSDPFAGADFNGDGAVDLVELTGYTSSFHTISAAPGPALDIALDSDPLVTNNGSATVTLNLPAASPEVVTLSASDPAVQLPASLNFAAGQSSQDFSFTLEAGFNAAHALALYATLGSETATAYASEPNPNLATGVAAQVGLPAGAITLTPGQMVATALSLSSEGGYSGTFSSFQCSGLPAGTSCSFGANSMTVAAGGTSGVSVTITTSHSTPFGVFPVQVTATDGFFQAVAPFRLGIGDFTISLNPSTVVTGPTGSALPTVTAAGTNGLNEPLTVTCTGLPASVACGPENVVSPIFAPSTGLLINVGGLAASDYPFQVEASDGTNSHMIGAILRVGDFTALISGTAATISAGQSASFTVSLQSLNHYANTISVFCQPAHTLACTATPSSVTLSDDGAAIVTLSVNAPASASALPESGPASGSYAWFAIVPVILFVVRPKPILRLAVLAIVISILAACTGGGGSAGTTGDNPAASAPSSPPPQTINVSVVASANVTLSEGENQKALGPIVVMLQ